MLKKLLFLTILFLGVLLLTIKSSNVYAAPAPGACTLETASACCGGCNSVKNIARRCCGVVGNPTVVCDPWYDTSTCEINTSYCSEFCSGGSCTEGSTGDCGTNGCSASEKSVCSGGSWSCYSDGTCGGSASCPWANIPFGCVTETHFLQKWPPGVCIGGGFDGSPCEYDADCADGLCNMYLGECNCQIMPENTCCQGLVRGPSNICLCPSCTASNPSKPQPLLLPSNMSKTFTNDVLVDWTDVSSWGTGCPSNINTYRARYVEKTAASCPAKGASYISKNTGSASETTLYDLNWGTTYCWYSEANNGSTSATSDETWEFITPKTPSLDDVQISTVGSCGNGISGNGGIPNVDNPITIMTEYSLDDDGMGVEEIDEVLLAIVPNDVRSANIVSEDSIAQVSNRYFMAKATINTVTPSLTEFSTVNSTSFPYYSAGVNTGTLSNSFGSGSLININNMTSQTHTHVEIVDANTVRVYWQVWFNDRYKYHLDDSLYTSVINANVYTAGLREIVPGKWNSSTGSNTIDRSLSRESSWGVNVQIPEISIGNAQVIDEDQFSMNWNVTGYDLTSADGYMWGNQSGYQLQRLSPSAAILNIPNSEPADFSSSNIGVGIGAGKSLGTHSYQLLSTQSAVLQTKMAVNDSACNRVIDSGSPLNLSGGWLMTAGGNAFGTNLSTNIPDQSNIVGDLSYLNDYSYLSTYLSSIKEDAFGTPSRISKNNFSIPGYNDWNQDPTNNTSFSSWVDYMNSLVAEKAIIHTVSATSMPTGQSTETFINTYAGQNVTNDNYTHHVRINGDFSTGGNNTCNTKTIFFISGNLNINPDFTIANRSTSSGWVWGAYDKKNEGEGSVKGAYFPTLPTLQTGCIFVVQGNVTIGSGTFKGGLYDNVHALFLVGGDFTTNTDDGGNPANARYDGLYIKGSVIATNFVLGRDMKLLNNIDKPSEIIEFDPRYANLFFDELKIDKYSIREKSYQKNLFE